MTGGVPRGAPPVGVWGRCMAPRVFRAPEGPAAREARHPHFVRRRASKPGQAPPPPTGTAARPRRRPRALQPGPVGRAARLSETAIAFAGAGRASTETAVAFAGAKWVFLVQFSGAEVSSVSMVAIQGRAVVLSVSTSPRYRASYAKKFALRGLMMGVSAKKFALHAQNTPKSAFSGVLGEFFCGNAAGGALLGELFRGNAAGGAVLGELIRANRPCAQVL